MKVKISVKKLFNMEQLIIALKEGNKRYLKEIEDLRNHTDDNAAYLHKLCKDQVYECRALDEQCEALKLEVEDLKKDRKDWEDAARSAADNL